MAKPLLHPPCSGWLSDLPEPSHPPEVPASLGYESPNYMDDIYLEISRHSSRMRGLIFWFSIIFAYLLVKYVLISRQNKHDDFESVVSWLMTVVISLWMCSLFFRLDVSPPRDLPLRFNRARQRIYAYNFKYRWWNPFERWQVVPVAYDWSQVRAERWKKRGATAQGALIIKWGVVLSIVKPGTNEVIDRFSLNTMGADEFAWAYICTYMQQGPEALPPPGPPHDHNDVPWYNLALRLAPKVKWPAEMDRESRTAS